MNIKTQQPLSTQILWVIGIIQPASANETHDFMKLAKFANEPDIATIEERLKIFLTINFVIRVHRTPDLYSLTLTGSQFFSRNLRYLRDQTRLFLLKDVNRVHFEESCDVLATGLDDDPSSSDLRYFTQGHETNEFRLVVPRAKIRWSRFSKQFIETGQTEPSHDTPNPDMVSFYEPVQLRVALGIQPNLFEVEPISLDQNAIGLMLGISPSLVTTIIRQNKGRYPRNGYYRSFDLLKRGGGTRQINSPRIFLKVILWFLNDFYLNKLKVDESVQSFRRGRSIINNAKLHTGQNFVANIDIENYFDSITFDNVLTLLQSNGYDLKSASVLAGLCTKDDALPQGAPTSPVISNAFLISFDRAMVEFCAQHNQTYSRYADDISVSGDNRLVIQASIDHAKNLLIQNYGLRLNESKTRIASKYSQQKVTGIVVNEKVLPPRKKRMKIRRKFYMADRFGLESPEDLEKLRGYYGYLNSFPDLRDSQTLRKYKRIIDKLTVKDKSVDNLPYSLD